MTGGKQAPGVSGSFPSFPESGRIDAAWLSDPGAAAAGEDPFLLVSTDPANPNYRDCFLGNGYIGQRLGPEGHAGFYDTRGECFVAGLWGRNALVSPPRWCGLVFEDGAGPYRVSSGRHDGYSQVVDMREGTAVTRSTWTYGGRTTDVETTVVLCRHRRQLAYVVTTITPQFEGEVRFRDGIDPRPLAPESSVLSAHFGARARAPPSTSDPNSRSGRHASMGPRLSTSLSIGFKNRPLALASDIRLETEDGDCAPRWGASSDPAGGLLAREATLAVRPGRSYRVVKTVALCTGEDCDGSPGGVGLAASGPLQAAELVLEGADFERDRAEHCAAWARLWESRIEVENPRLQKLLNGALFQLYSNLREDVAWSLGPAGLSGPFWNGRVFWDADMWVFPPLALLRPELAASIAKYRARTLPGALQNAKQDGYEGACWAWESADTGEEAVPHPYEIIHHQRHVNSDVALAQWHYYLTSGDAAFFERPGGGRDIIIQSALYWASRVHYNAEKDRYELLGVYCADEFAQIQNNNASTNYGAAFTLRLAAALMREARPPIPEPSGPADTFDDIADRLWYPFDEEARRYVEYDGYNGETIKQADTALMIYPYEMPMDDDVKANVVDYYSAKYPAKKIMMGSALDGVVDAELCRPEAAWGRLLELLPHFRGPFLLVSESPANEVISFQTGLGGLLQLVLNGFAGIRIRKEGLFVAPCLPAACLRIAVRGLHFGGARFDLEVGPEGPRATNFSGAAAAAPFEVFGREGPVPRVTA